MTNRWVQELLTTGKGTEGSLLIPKKIYDTLVDEVTKVLIGRQHAAFVIGPDGIPGSSVDVNLVTPNSLQVQEIAEGAAIPIKTVEYESFNLKPKKYGIRIPTTKEMQEDANWDLISHNLRTAARKVAENENKLILSDALDNAGNTVTGGSQATISNIVSAMLNLEDSDYTPNVMFVGNEFASDLRTISTFVEAQRLGTREAFTNGLVGEVYAMQVVRFSSSSGAAPSTTYSKYAYIIDSNHAFVMAEKRPPAVSEYDDKIHDLSGAVITQRIKIRHLRANAIAKITTT